MSDCSVDNVITSGKVVSCSTCSEQDVRVTKPARSSIFNKFICEIDIKVKTSVTWGLQIRLSEPFWSRQPPSFSRTIRHGSSCW